MEFNFDPNLGGILITVVTMVVSWGLAKLDKWMDAKAESVKQKNEHDKLDKYIDLAKDAVMTAVRAFNQSVVEDLKEAASDGKLTVEEQQNIFNEATQNVLITLSPNLQDTLSAAYGDLPTWVRNQILNAITSEKERKAGLIDINTLVDTEETEG